MAMSYDNTAVSIILSRALSGTQKQRTLTSLAREARVQIGETCPECGHTSAEHDWNGCYGIDASYLCCNCKHVWDPCA